MKLDILQETITPVLRLLKQVTPSRPTLPILACVHMQAADGWLVLTASDLTVKLTMQLAAHVDTPGEACVPVDRLFKLCEALPDGPASLALKQSPGRRLHVSAGERRTWISGYDPEDYPQPSEPNAAESVTVQAGALAAALARVTIAAAKEKDALGRPQFGAVHCSAEGVGLALACADGLRLACDTIQADGAAVFGDGLLFPAPALVLARHLLADADTATFELPADRRSIGLTVGRSRLRVQRLEYAFPAWRQLIPREFTTRITLSAHALLSELAAAAAIEPVNEIIRLVIKGDTLRLSAKSAEQLGSYEGEIPIANDSEDGRVALNLVMLRDVAAALSGGEIEIALNAPDKPVRITRAGGDDPYVYIQMPMFVDWSEPAASDAPEPDAQVEAAAVGIA